MAKQTFLITISNTEDLSLLGHIQLESGENGLNIEEYETVFKHELRSLFNDPLFVELAAEFAVKTVELDNETATDPTELTEISDARQS